MGSNLEGRIKGLSLPAFLQMSEMEETSCTLKIISKNGAIGFLYLLKGQLISAETGQLKNLQAAYQIIAWEEPIIEIEKEIKKTVNEINQPLMNILMDGLRVKDENQSPLTGAQPADEDLLAEAPENELELELELEPDAPDGEHDPVLRTGVTFPQPIDPASLPGRPLPDTVVEARILAFQNKIAIACPLCAVGKILQKASAEKVSYFACSNVGCNFISRQKPYRLNCPKCNNPFLIEFPVQGQTPPGLKCPRLECGFQHNSLILPSRHSPGEPPDDRITRIVRVVRKKPS